MNPTSIAVGMAMNASRNAASGEAGIPGLLLIGAMLIVFFIVLLD